MVAINYWLVVIDDWLVVIGGDTGRACDLLCPSIYPVGLSTCVILMAGCK